MTPAGLLQRRKNDAPGAVVVPEGDGYVAALVNFRYMANDLMTTEEAVAATAEAAGSS